MPDPTERFEIEDLRERILNKIKEGKYFDQAYFYGIPLTSFEEEGQGNGQGRLKR